MCHPELVSGSMHSKNYYVYILASKPNGTLYIGVTDNLARRMEQHRSGILEGFTKRYAVHCLVYYEQTNDVLSAISREKQLKRWHRDWKINLITEKNPSWEDLYNPGS